LISTPCSMKPLPGFSIHRIHESVREFMNHVPNTGINPLAKPINRAGKNL
jgi:hypothetical protein